MKFHKNYVHQVFQNNIFLCCFNLLLLQRKLWWTLIDLQHPDYGSGPGAFPNDIAVIELTTAANLDSAFIDTIAMAEGDYDYAGERCIISGWGVTTEGGGSLPAILQEAQTNVISNAECEGTWGSNINDGHVCIHNPDEGVSSCNVSSSQLFT